MCHGDLRVVTHHLARREPRSKPTFNLQLTNTMYLIYHDKLAFQDWGILEEDKGTMERGQGCRLR